MRPYLIVKRILDFFFAFVLLIILFPLMLLVAIAIKLDSAGPVIFKQKRLGRGKACFYMYKFRTMRVNTPKNIPTHLFANSEIYITRVGGFLRRYSLDELPQLFNILKGEMSIIGPRPALWNQIDLIMERDKYNANDVLPGLTGWAQINGRDTISIKDKAKFDGIYVKQMGFWMDIKCFIGTIVIVLKSRDVLEGGTSQFRKGTTIEK
jgi:O-antigen biosynthesis protein WbqP